MSMILVCHFGKVKPLFYEETTYFPLSLDLIYYGLYSQRFMKFSSRIRKYFLTAYLSLSGLDICSDTACPCLPQPQEILSEPEQRSRLSMCCSVWQNKWREKPSNGCLVWQNKWRDQTTNMLLSLQE